MFKVELFNDDKFEAIDNLYSEAYRFAQWAGSKCYNPDMQSQMVNSPKLNVKSALWKPGHHTTLEHDVHYMSFDIENIPVSLVTFGLHMTHPFYNSSQRSGRYCLDIFGNDLVRYHDYIKTFLNTFYPDCQYQNRILDWFTSGLIFFKLHLDEMTQLAKEAILAERPHYVLDIDTQARRIAQEQLRVFISTIVPTGLVYTINIPTLYAMYKTAWNSPLKVLVEMMENKFSIRSDLSFNDTITKSVNDYTPTFYTCRGINCEETIIDDINVISIHDNTDFAEELMYIDSVQKGFIDTTFFDPHCVPNLDKSSYLSNVTVPVVTYGQDQRHRMIKRSNPIITGQFYLPPLVDKLKGAREFANKFMTDYNELVSLCSPSIMLFFIPYGAMVNYNKECDVRAYHHSISKRLCYNAERTICSMEQQTLLNIFNCESVEDLPIGPPCKDGTCYEGKRFCGRDLQNRKQRILI